MHVIVAANLFLDPIVNAITNIVNAIDVVVHNRGWSLVLFALGIKLLFWPLNTKQFMSMIKMQQLAPQLKALQAKYAKADPQRYQKETMELYKRHGANPLAGCWPMLIQYPIIISVWYAVTSKAHRHLYDNAHWLWIGSPLTAHSPHFWNVSLFAANLASGDLVLLVLYAVSMYFYSRYATMPSTDPQQAQMQKMMAIMSPLMLGFFGLRYNWPSAMVLYWFSFNAFTMAQQFYLLKRYHQPLSALDNEHAITEAASTPEKALPSSNGAAAAPASSPATKSSGQRRSRNGKKKKKGAKR